jgi:hypothetical protein
MPSSLLHNDAQACLQLKQTQCQSALVPSSASTFTNGSSALVQSCDVVVLGAEAGLPLGLTLAARCPDPAALFFVGYFQSRF